jgi:hypothetical protein
MTPHLILNFLTLGGPETFFLVGFRKNHHDKSCSISNFLSNELLKVQIRQFFDFGELGLGAVGRK